jgi:hypothetical protein
VLANLIECAMAADSTGSFAADFDSSDGIKLTRPTGLTSDKACESVTSHNDRRWDVPCAGARSRAKTVRSHVGNGAVNGENVRATSEKASAFRNIDRL